MTNDDYRYFVCIAAGDDPQKLMDLYDKNKNTEKHTVYRYKDADLLRSQYLQVYEDMLKEDISETEREYIKISIEDIEDMTADEFYYDLSKNYEIDDETGDAVETKNSNGKFSYCQIGKHFCVPFLTNDGREIFQALKSSIDWDKIHLNGGDTYKRTWEMVMEGSKPETEQEEQIFNVMQDKQTYFKKFETKENYVLSNTAFWGYAFVSEKTGWVDADNCEDQFLWMRNFYDMFIKNLPEDTLLTIYECKK